MHRLTSKVRLLQKHYFSVLQEGFCSAGGWWPWLGSSPSSSPCPETGSRSHTQHSTINLKHSLGDSKTRTFSILNKVSTLLTKPRLFLFQLESLVYNNQPVESYDTIGVGLIISVSKFRILLQKLFADSCSNWKQGGWVLLLVHPKLEG